MSKIKTVERPVISGCDDLREWLLAQGFTCTYTSPSGGNACNWYAFRRSKYPARECECNEGKKMQIVITPFAYSDANTQVWQSVEINVIGEVQGLWFKLCAYSVDSDELKARLHEIEARLIASWNALAPYDVRANLPP